MKPSDDEVNLIWASEQKEEVPELNIAMDTLQSLCKSEESVEITRRTYSSKNKNTFVCSPPKKTRYHRPTFLSKKKRRGRKFDYYRLASQLFSPGPLKKRVSILEKILLSKRISSGSSFTCQVPQRSLSRIVVTEETICMDSPTKDKSQLRRSSYCRVSAVHIHETNKSGRDESMPLIQSKTTSGDLSISRAFLRLMRPRKKNVRMQTLPETQLPPPPSPTDSEKEIDNLRRLELFKSSRAYRRLTAPPKPIEASKPPVYKRRFFDQDSLPEELNERIKDLQTTCVYPASNSSRYYKMVSYKRKNLIDPFYSPKTMALIERASFSTSSTEPPKSIPQKFSITPYKNKRVFERLTSVKTPVYHLRSRTRNRNISDFSNPQTDLPYSPHGNSNISDFSNAQNYSPCSQPGNRNISDSSNAQTYSLRSRPGNCNILDSSNAQTHSPRSRPGNRIISDSSNLQTYLHYSRPGNRNILDSSNAQSDSKRSRSGNTNISNSFSLQSYLPCSRSGHSNISHSSNAQTDLPRSRPGNPNILNSSKKQTDLPRSRSRNSNTSDSSNAQSDGPRSRYGNPNIVDFSNVQTDLPCSQSFIQRPLLTVDRNNSMCFKSSNCSVQYLRNCKGFPSEKVFERLTAPPKPKKESYVVKGFLTQKSSSEENVSSQIKLGEFQSFPAYQRRKNSPRKANSEILWEQDSTKKCKVQNKEESENALDQEHEEEEQHRQPSPIFVRLIAPRKTPRMSNWGRDSLIKRSFTFQKLTNLLNNSLISDPEEEIEEKPPQRMTLAFRRLTAPYYKRSRHEEISPTLDNLLKTSESSAIDRKPILKNSLICRQNISDPHIESKTIRSVSKINVSSAQDERHTDTSYETISETSDISGTTYEISDVSQDSEFNDQESVPLLGRTHASWNARAECNNILGEIATLKRKMAERMSQMAYEIYDGSKNARNRKKYTQDRNQSGSVWVPLKSFQPIYDLELRNPKERWSQLITPTYPSV